MQGWGKEFFQRPFGVILFVTTESSYFTQIFLSLLKMSLELFNPFTPNTN